MVVGVAAEVPAQTELAAVALVDIELVLHCQSRQAASTQLPLALAVPVVERRMALTEPRAAIPRLALLPVMAAAVAALRTIMQG